MIELVLVFALVLLLVAGMAVGVLAGREPIRGTCGGLNAMGADGSCDICGGNPAKCDAADISDGATETSSDIADLAQDAMAQSTATRATPEQNPLAELG